MRVDRIRYCRNSVSRRLKKRSGVGQTFLSRNVASAASFWPLIPAQRAAGLILDYPGLEKVLLLVEVDHLRHPRERVVGLVEQRVDADLLTTAGVAEGRGVPRHGRAPSPDAAPPWG